MISKALEIENNDFEDTLQYLSAKSADCEYVITNDKSFYFPIPKICRFI